MSDPADDFFDLDRLRKKWEATPEAPRPIVHRVLAQVAPAFDPRAAAADTMKALREACAQRLPDRVEALAPFLDQVEKALAELPERGGDPKLAAEALARFTKALDPLEELLEVFAFVSKRR